MTEQQASKSQVRRAARTPDAGAPARGGEPAASHTVPAADPDLHTVRTGAVRGAVIESSLPVGPDQVPAPGAVGVPVPASAPSAAPAGSAPGNATVDLQAGKANEHDPGPRVAYVVTWSAAAVHVHPDQAQTRTVDDDGDDAKTRTERYVTVQSQTGTRDVVLAGEQVTLLRGEVLPEQAVDGVGPFLVSIGAAVAVSIPPTAAAEAGD